MQSAMAIPLKVQQELAARDNGHGPGLKLTCEHCGPVHVAIVQISQEGETKWVARGQCPRCFGMAERVVDLN